MPAQLTRRAALAALPLVAVHGRARAAEFSWKFATGQDPTHPVNRRGQEAADHIREATGGRLDIRLFPANQLGSDTDLISQVRSGGIEMLNISGSILATAVPVCGITNVGFAFPGYDKVWEAMDGALGKHIFQQVERVGMTPLAKFWDNGFRNVTSGTREIKAPADLKGFKIRVPASPILTSLFAALGAGPTPINFNEVYTALQTKLVEGQENPLAIIATAKLYEVQKSLSLTGHVWDGYLVVGNRRAAVGLPAELREVLTRELDRAGADERADIVKLSGSLQADLQAKGLALVEVDRGQFRDALRGTSFYKDWQAKFGPEAWAMLQAVSGPLA